MHTPSQFSLYHLSPGPSAPDLAVSLFTSSGFPIPPPPFLTVVLGGGSLEQWGV